MKFLLLDDYNYGSCMIHYTTFKKQSKDKRPKEARKGCKRKRNTINKHTLFLVNVQYCIRRKNM